MYHSFQSTEQRCADDWLGGGAPPPGICFDSDRLGFPGLSDEAPASIITPIKEAPSALIPPIECAQLSPPPLQSEAAPSTPPIAKSHPRTPNSWILFRTDFVSQPCRTRNQRKLSKEASDIWNLMPDSEKEVWRQKAAALAPKKAGKKRLRCRPISGSSESRRRSTIPTKPRIPGLSCWRLGEPDMYGLGAAQSEPFKFQAQQVRYSLHVDFAITLN